jgi:hypothetical protein
MPLRPLPVGDASRKKNANELFCNEAICRRIATLDRSGRRHASLADQRFTTRGAERREPAASASADKMNFATKTGSHRLSWLAKW